jgi:prefoldin subunit 5
LEDIKTLQTNVHSLQTEMDTIEDSIRSLNTANFEKLNQLITGPVILWGGNATSNWGESE